MGIFKKNPIKHSQRSMRYCAIRAIEVFKKEGVRTAEVEQLINDTRYWAHEILKIDPTNEEAKKHINFPESLAESLTK